MDISSGASVAALLPQAFNTARAVWGKIDQALDNSIRSAHLEYATNVIKKHSYAKTFLIRSTPAYLYDFYVPASVQFDGDRKLEKVDIESLSAVSRRLIITGSGGSGKSILMRHLLLDALAQANVFPILIELRNLNDNDRSLRGEILENLRVHGFDLDEKYVDQSLSDGAFVLLLDGFDEVQKSSRKRLERDIRLLSNSSSCQIVITSREDASLQSWPQFTTARISRLTLDEACDLVERVNFDPDIKAQFLHNLKGGLFVTHEFFLSNPLLLSIMLLTYGDSAEIPRKLSSFYHQAFEALFHGHDALKGSFKRDRATDLDIYEFAKLFSAFCILTFDARAFRFSRIDALRHVRKSIELTGLHRVSPEGFLDDARQAVCMLLEDGLELAFIHRSFQEYFAARFISDADEVLKKKLIEKVTRPRSGLFHLDNVIDLLHEMAPDSVERYFLIPRLETFFGGCSNRRVSRTFWLEKFKSNVSQVLIDVEKIPLSFVIDRDAKDYSLLAFVASYYPLDKVFEVESWIASGRALVKIHGIKKSFRTADLKVGSKLVADLSDLHWLWSVSGFEQVRKRFRDMKVGAAARAAAVDRIFS